VINIVDEVTTNLPLVVIISVQIGGALGAMIGLLVNRIQVTTITQQESVCRWHVYWIISATMRRKDIRLLSKMLISTVDQLVVHTS